MSGAAFDWQFLVVTLAALAGAVVLLRPLLPSRRATRQAATGPCGRCSSASCGKESSAGPTGLVTLGAGRGSTARSPSST